jgi:DNA-binding NarL/FixJ family response regulator
MRISILIADDNALVRQSLRNLLETEIDFRVLGEASDGIEAVELSEHFQPDILILDISMPRLSGLSAIPRVHEVSSPTRIIIFSNHASKSYSRIALDNGAFGYVLKSPEEIGGIVQVIHQVSNGVQYVSSRLL